MASRGGRRRAKGKAAATAGPVAVRQAAPTASRIEIGCWVVLFAGAVGALLWKHAAFFFYTWTDEQIHFYVAHRMAEGAVLYRDIDSARPPLVAFPVAWLIEAGCSPLMAGRALVFATQLATAGLLLWGGWRLASWRAGAWAALLFLASPDTFARIHYTGIHLVALTVTACVLFSLRAQPLRAGLCLGLTLAADQHGLVVGGMVALFTVWRRPRDALPFVLGAVTVSALVFGGVWVSGGRNLWASLVGIHLYHLRVGQGASAQFWQRFLPWLYEHAYVLAGVVLAAVLLWTRRAGEDAVPPSSRTVRVVLLVVAAHVAAVLAMAEAVFLYVVVVAPLLMLLAGMGFAAAVDRWRQGRRSPPAGARRASRLMLAGCGAVLALLTGGWAAARAQREGLDHREYSFWPHVLHGQVDRFQRLDAALQGISESLLPKRGTIFGDPTIVSALALHSGRRVSGELVDLNPNWLEAGTVKPEHVVSRIEGDGVAAVISPPWGLVQDPTFKSYLFACYQKPQPFFPPQSGPGEGLPFFLVFTRTSNATPCQAAER